MRSTRLVLVAFALTLAGCETPQQSPVEDKPSAQLKKQAEPKKAFEPATAEEFSKRAWEHMASGDREAALADFDKALELDATHQLARWGRSRARTAAGDFHGALEDLKTAEKKFDWKLDCEISVTRLLDADTSQALTMAKRVRGGDFIFRELLGPQPQSLQDWARRVRELAPRATSFDRRVLLPYLLGVFTDSALLEEASKPVVAFGGGVVRLRGEEANYYKAVRLVRSRFAIGLRHDWAGQGAKALSHYKEILPQFALAQKLWHKHGKGWGPNRLLGTGPEAAWEPTLEASYRWALGRAQQIKAGGRPLGQALPSTSKPGRLKLKVPDVGEVELDCDSESDTLSGVSLKHERGRFRQFLPLRPELSVSGDQFRWCGFGTSEGAWVPFVTVEGKLEGTSFKGEIVLWNSYRYKPKAEILSKRAATGRWVPGTK